MPSETEEAKSGGGKSNLTALNNNSNKLYFRNTTEISSMKKS